MSKKVVIIGGGFGGLTAAKVLRNADVEITLIDKTNHHLFQPLLYQVATAALSAGDIASPIRGILRKQKNVQVILGEVVRIDPERRQVYLYDKHFDYDYLILAIGSRSSYFGNPEWEKYAAGLKTIPDALLIRDRILLSFEKAERADNDKEIQKYLTIVVVGGGSTGVEVAGALAETSEQLMKKDFRRIPAHRTRIIMLEAADSILATFDSELQLKAMKSLERLGVDIRLNTRVTDIDEKGVWIGDELIETNNIIWVAGTEVSPLIKTLNIETDRVGKAIIENDCSLKGYPDVFVIGDAASFAGGERPLPAVAPVATQQGSYVARIIRTELSGGKRRPFKYADKGSLAVIGRARAVLQVGNRLKISGFVAWFVWAFVHILVLIQFRNRYRVMAEWIWYYITKRPGIGLITGYNNSKSQQ